MSQPQKKEKLTLYPSKKIILYKKFRIQNENDKEDVVTSSNEILQTDKENPVIGKIMNPQKDKEILDTSNNETIIPQNNENNENHETSLQNENINSEEASKNVDNFSSLNMTNVMLEAIESGYLNYLCEIQELNSECEFHLETAYNSENSCKPIQIPSFPETVNKWKLFLYNRQLILKYFGSGPIFVSGTCKIDINGFETLGTISFENLLNTNDEIFIEDTSIRSLPDNFIIKIYCQIKETILHNQEIYWDWDKEKEENSIKDYLKLLFEVPKFSDVEYHVEGAKFLAHKAIIQVRSPDFWIDIMKVNPQIINTGCTIIQISDIDPAVFKEFLRFIYLDKIDESNCDLQKLFKLAHVYKMKKLKLICENILCKNINPDNISELLDLAIATGTQNLKLEILKYCFKNFWTIDHMIIDFVTKNYFIEDQTKLQTKAFPVMESFLVQGIQKWTFHNIQNLLTHFQKVTFLNIKIKSNSFNFIFSKKNNESEISLTVSYSVKGLFNKIEFEIVVINQNKKIEEVQLKSTTDFHSNLITFNLKKLANDESVKDSNLIVFLHIRIYKKKSEVLEAEDFESTLIKDINTLYENKTFTDIIVHAKNTEFNAHRFILGTHSSIFSKLFAAKQTEKHFSVQCSSQVLTEILRFCYTGKVYNLNEMAFEMFETLHDLKITSKLLDMCENAICSMLDSNYLKCALKLAYKYNSQVLKTKCMNYISEFKLNDLEEFVGLVSQNIELHNNLKMFMYQKVLQGVEPINLSNHYVIQRNTTV